MKGPTGESVRFAQAEWEYGYRMEIALPWAAIGAVRRAGDAIGLDVHVNDNDGTGREDKLMWSDSGDLAQRRPAPFRAGHAAADRVVRARATPPPSRRPRATCARRARRGRLCASSTTTSAPTRPA